MHETAAASAEKLNRTAEAPWPDALLGLGGLAPDHNGDSRVSSAAVQSPQCERLPPYPDDESVRFKSGRERARSGRDRDGPQLVARHARGVPNSYLLLGEIFVFR